MWYLFWYHMGGCDIYFDITLVPYMTKDTLKWTFTCSFWSKMMKKINFFSKKCIFFKKCTFSNFFFEKNHFGPKIFFLQKMIIFQEKWVSWVKKWFLGVFDPLKPTFFNFSKFWKNILEPNFRGVVMVGDVIQRKLHALLYIWLLDIKSRPRA